MFLAHCQFLFFFFFLSHASRRQNTADNMFVCVSMDLLVKYHKNHLMDFNETQKISFGQLSFWTLYPFKMHKIHTFLHAQNSLIALKCI